MEPITVKYKVLDARAKVPAYATPGAAAADLCAVLDAPLTVAPMQRVLVPTGLAIELPDAGCVALVYARSGLSIKHGLCMANGVGVVDSDYRGELKVPMINLGTEPYTIAPGERVAQLCIAPVWQAAMQANMHSAARLNVLLPLRGIHQELALDAYRVWSSSMEQAHEAWETLRRHHPEWCARLVDVARTARAMGWDEQDELFSHALTMAMRPAEDTGVNATVRLPELG